MSQSNYDNDPVFQLHRGGKISVQASVDVPDGAVLAMAYTPGVARVCSAIADNSELAAEYTWVPNTVAVVTDGSAVLGLGDIGPAAAMPVMEGKALLFKRFGGIDAVPLCLAATGVDQIVDTVSALAPSFAGINLEDISAPRCFEIEEKLRSRLEIPVFHDDQHGTAIVTLAALRGAAKVVGKPLSSLRVVIAGAGASGIAVAKILLSAGVGDIAVSDSKGLIYQGRDGLNPQKAAIAELTNKAGLTGSTESALSGADVFIGLSCGSVAEKAIASMADGSIVFVLSNPDPEIHPDVARKHAAVVATGRSDFPNQINNSLAFPGVFRGALDVRATTITEAMKLAAAEAIAGLVGDGGRADYIIPSQFDDRVAPAVAAAVAAQARADGVARR